MGLNPLVRSYNMADSDLLQRADALLNSITRDAADFATRGVDASRLALFMAARTAFSEFPTDDELAGGVATAAEGKDAARSALETAIRSIRNMAEIRFKGNGLYKTFGFDDLTRQTDNDLFRMGRRVWRVGTSLLSSLASEGLTTALLDRLLLLTNTYDQQIDAVAAAVEERDIQTQQRIQYGNNLFAQLSDLASIGKNLYEDVDEARHNDYVIHDPATPTSSDTPPTGA